MCFMREDIARISKRQKHNAVDMGGFSALKYFNVRGVYREKFNDDDGLIPADNDVWVF